ncbi:MAG TPA: hypothetical protein VKN73_12645 [Desulfosalsimonadaceae bacterium]|nr:hypothetical protein [Desulfosalsimonadaceae bacterium]
MANLHFEELVEEFDAEKDRCGDEQKVGYLDNFSGHICVYAIGNNCQSSRRAKKIHSEQQPIEIFKMMPWLWELVNWRPDGFAKSNLYSAETAFLQKLTYDNRPVRILFRQKRLPHPSFGSIPPGPTPGTERKNNFNKGTEMVKAPRH